MSTHNCLNLGSYLVMAFLLMACNNSSPKQKKEDPPPMTDTPTAMKNPPSGYIPEGYFIFERIAGDLNKDNVQDSVFIVKKIDKENIVVDEYRGELDRNRRGIMVFFDKGNTWELMVQNMDCFSSENEDGGVYFPPELSIEIQKGNLYINYGHGRYGHWSHTFRYQNEGFELIGYDQSDNYGPIVKRSTSINYLTQKKLIRTNVNEDAEESGEEVFEEKWENMEDKPLLKLSKIEDFDGLQLL